MTTPPVFCAKLERQRRLAAGGRPCDKHGLAHNSANSPRMSLVATLICNPANPALDTTIVDGALRRSALARPGAMAVRRSGGRHSLRQRRADDIKAIEARLREARGDLPIDIVVQPAARPAQEAFSGRHGFHHDRPGMHRRTGRFRRPEGACRRHHRTRDARRNRVRAGAARARRAAEGSAGQRRRRGAGKAHHADAGRPRTGRDHARPRRLHLPDLGRLHAVHQRGRRHDRLSGKPRQRADGSRRQVHRRGHRADPGPRRQARDADRAARSPSISTTSTRWWPATAPTISA